MSSDVLDAIRRWRGHLEADDRRAVAHRGVEAVCDVLGVDRAAVLLADERMQTLRFVGLDSEDLSDRDHPAWRAVLQGESVVVAEDGVFDGTERVLPMDDSGALVVPGRFEDDDLAVVRLLADELRTALERADRVRRANDRGPDPTVDRTERTLDRLVGLVESVGDALARSPSGEETVRLFCERLAAVDGYALAWYGDYRPGRGSAVPEVWAGVDDDYLRTVELSPDGAFGTAFESVVSTHEVAVVDPIDAESGPEAVGARERGYRSLALVPVAHGDALYGVAAVYADRRRAFGPYADAILDGLGVAVGAALSAAEHRRALMTDAVVELEFRLRDSGMVLVWLSERADCRLELAGLFLDRDDALRLFLETSGSTLDQLRAAADDHPEIADATLIAEREDERLVRVTLSESSLAEHLAELGAALRSVSVESGSGRATVELPATGAVRSFVERVLSAYPDTELLARHEHTRRLQTPHEYRSLLEKRLTDRQHEALQTAYYGGFFEWPRENTGEDVSDTLGVAQPTFLQHLRAAERKLLAEFFDEEGFVYSQS
ncbi:bacterio-opsin activator domain-containing protein [Halorussus sp. AFM4]|uniref:bacterio-opsin activator domain-containing protein n=1 Tax=Halorussus sp. AFM4 TaxID=3421651 RepID=UPI003EC14A94